MGKTFSFTKTVDILLTQQVAGGETIPFDSGGLTCHFTTWDDLNVAQKNQITTIMAGLNLTAVDD